LPAVEQVVVLLPVVLRLVAQAEVAMPRRLLLEPLALQIPVVVVVVVVPTVPILMVVPAAVESLFSGTHLHLQPQFLPVVQWQLLHLVTIDTMLLLLAVVLYNLFEFRFRR
jgi:hypothetical protein